MRHLGRRIIWILLLAAVSLGGRALWHGLRPLGNGHARPGVHAARAPRPSLLTAALPEPRGGHTLRGRVVGPGGPVAEAAIIATGAGGEDLAAIPSGCRFGEALLDGECAPAVWTLAELADQHRGEAPAVGRAISNPDGSFELTGLPPGRVTLWAESGRGIALLQDVSSGAAGVELKLEPGRVLAGQVLGDHGEPLPNVPVTALSGAHRRYFDGQSDAHGRFLIGPVPPGAYTLVASAEGRLPARASADAPAPPTLTLFTPLRLAGRVVRDGQPVRGAAVELTSGPSTGKTSSDAQGQFELTLLHPGVYGVVATAGLGRGTEWVRLSPGADKLEVEVLLTDGAEISGRVTDERGRPIAGAEISGASDEPLAGTRTGADGEYRLGPLGPGRYQLWAKAREHRASPIEPVVLAPGQRARVDFQLRAGVAIRGIVVDPDGQPVAGAIVQVTGVPPSSGARGDVQGFGSYVTNAAGVFETDGLDPGDYHLVTTHERFLAAAADVQAPGSEVRLVLPRGGVLQGEVLDEHDQPVKGARVRADSASRTGGAPEAGQLVRQARTDYEGRFRIEGLDRGAYEVEVVLDGAVSRRASAPAEVSPGAPTRVTIRFAGGSPLRGRVVDRDGAPFEGVPLVAVPEADPTNPDFLREVTTGPDGGFALHDLAPGRYRIRARLSGYHALESAVGEPGGAPVSMVLEQDAVVRGHVRREDGRPYTTFSVDGVPMFHPDGSFEVPEPSEPVKLVVSAPGAAPGIVTVMPGASRGEPLEVVLRAGRRVAGTVIDASTGEPLPNADVWLQVEGQPEDGEALPQARTDATGAFVLPHVDGSSVLLVKEPGFREAWQPVAGGELNVRIGLTRLGTVRGRVVGVEVRPPETLEIVADGPTHQTTAPKANGTYELLGLEAGEYTLTLLRKPDVLLEQPPVPVATARITVSIGALVIQDLQPSAPDGMQ